MTPRFPHSPKRDKLARLIEQARARAPMTIAELKAQRRSYVRAEAGFGSDADERAMRDAMARGDKAEIKRLDMEAEARMAAVDRFFDEGGAL